MLDKPCHHIKGYQCRRFRRMTLPRQVILEALAISEEPQSAEEIFLKVHQTYPQIGLATIYRTLDILTEEGVVLRLEPGDRRARYAVIRANDANPIYYLICTRCGKIEECRDLTGSEQELLDQATSMLANKYQFRLKFNHIQLRGVCQQCQNS